MHKDELLYCTRQEEAQAVYKRYKLLQDEQAVYKEVQLYQLLQGGSVIPVTTKAYQLQVTKLQVKEEGLLCKRRVNNTKEVTYTKEARIYTNNQYSV